MKQNEELAMPFFARFLESQERTAPNTQGIIPWPWPPTTRPGGDYETHKAPSDSDEDIYI